MIIDPIYFNQFTVIKSKVSFDILKLLKEEAKYILNNQDKFEKYNHTLGGNLEKEYSVYESEEILKETLYNLANEYYRYSEKNEDYPNWNIKDIWINFQKKYEYNPIHNHTGNLSFVIWIQIPYELKSELELPNSKNSNNPMNSLFYFVYTNFLGKTTISPVYVDKSWEGTILMFPSSLNHGVYPFYTSDNYRISISGNLDTISN
jgi:hypothetical protein